MAVTAAAAVVAVAVAALPQQITTEREAVAAQRAVHCSYQIAVADGGDHGQIPRTRGVSEGE